MEQNRPFDLVYRSFERMLLVARGQWKRLVCNGLYLSGGLMLLIASSTILSQLLTHVRLYSLAIWIMAACRGRRLLRL
jgi:hypothetical protein